MVSESVRYSIKTSFTPNSATGRMEASSADQIWKFIDSFLKSLKTVSVILVHSSLYLINKRETVADSS
jgi:hypothetical protein